MKQYVDLCHRFQVADEAQVSHAELERYLSDLATFEGYTNERFGLESMTFGVRPLPELVELLRESVGGRTAVIGVWTMRLGSHAFTQVLAVCGQLELLHVTDDGAFQLKVPGETVARLNRFAQPEQPSDDILSALIDQARTSTWQEGEIRRYLALAPHVLGEPLMIAE